MYIYDRIYVVENVDACLGDASSGPPPDGAPFVRLSEARCKSPSSGEVNASSEQESPYFLFCV